MGKWKVGTIIAGLALIVSVPSAILAYRAVPRPWPSKTRVVQLETQVAGLRYESVLGALLRCQSLLSRDRNNQRLRQRCAKLERLLRRLEK